MPYELQSEEVIVCEETLTVSQASNIMELDRSELVTAASENVSDMPPEGARERYEQYVRTLLYPSLAACTSGSMPTVDEFLYTTPSVETKRWVQKAKKLNPRWFTFVSDDGVEEDIEKKELSLTDSTPV